MITRLYADNYKTLVNFELPLGPINLLLGANGSGKSTVLQTIRLIRNFVARGNAAAGLFPTSTLCRWDTRRVQTFEIDLPGEEGTYTYRLEIEHEVDRDRCRVKSELLIHNQRPLYVSNADGAQIYQDGVAVGKRFLVDKNRSGVSVIRGNATTLLLRFKKRLKMAWSLHIDPDRMTTQCDAEAEFPRFDMSRFAAWYRHLVQDQPTRVFELAEILKNEVLDGFRSLRLKAVGEKSRALWRSSEPRQVKTLLIRSRNIVSTNSRTVSGR